jgi:hypothetical protein
MALEPTAERTYTVIPRVAVAQQGSLVATNRLFLRTIVNQLIAAGATCHYSCDSVTAGAAGDGINRWDADSDVVFGDAGARSWMVLELPAGLGGMHLLIEATTDGGSAADGDVNAHLAISGFTGGTTTTLPVPVDGAEPFAGTLTGGSGGNLPSAGNYAAHVNVVYATNGTSIRVIVTNDTNDAVISLLLLETLGGGPAAYVLPYTGTWYSGDAPADLVSFVQWPSWRATLGDPAIAVMVTLGFSAGIIPDYIVSTNGDGSYHLFPVGVFEGTGGWHGYIPDLFFLVNDTTTVHTTLPSGTGRRWACFGSIVVPWDGATDLGGGSINGDPILMAAAGGAGGATPPTITDISPTPSTQLASRQTPIVLTVQDAAPGLRLAVLTLRYTTIPGTFVVHDGTAFQYPFDSATAQRVATATGYTYTLLPRGGWAGDIAQLFVYAVDSAGNMEGSLP